ncbi:superoxide dismutase [Carboxydochorda subterranea]|uniref:superoxide dismutase n=1 Tax=Carboxydichorda subterranea TaxID=3109565 RepID=A0ABZ1BZQ7_9FIRM|nr:superoxide dismutase [Limnochorda sp. L945t]WRP18050.1 superoxide dismutase [Limnochorda sp. L945t]
MSEKDQTGRYLVAREAGAVKTVVQEVAPPPKPAPPVAPAPPGPLQLPRAAALSGEVPIGGHRLPPLPYPYDALEPYISARIMQLHHDVHHRTCVEELNRAELALQQARRLGNFQQARWWEQALAFHGSGHFLHSLFWLNMAPSGGGVPADPALRAAIDVAFGSFAAFQAQFSAAANQVEGSGWALLVWSPAAGRLEILQAQNHPWWSQWGALPLLVLDVWEHAYYLQYESRRARYVEMWWHVVNWADVAARLAMVRSVALPPRAGYPPVS